MKRIFVFCVLVIVIAGCHKEKELLTGDVMGKITVYNQDYSFASDYSGVQVSLYDDNKTLLYTKVTDGKGLYRFEDIEYGKYNIDLVKDKYIKPAYVYSFNHLGGYSPTLKDGSVYNIPEYVLTIDSLKVNTSERHLLVYLKIDGSVKFPFQYYTLIGYCSDSPTVSMDNYSFILKGTAGSSFPFYPEIYFKANAIIRDIYRNFSTETIYIRFYLLTHGQSIYSAINKEALGKPSNVVTFVWQ